MHSDSLRNLNGRGGEITAQDHLPKSAPGLRQGRDEMRGGTETCLTELTFLQCLSSGERTGDPPATKETKPMEEET